jgi:hypothetical protein
MAAYTEKKCKAFCYDLIMFFFKKLFSLWNLIVNNLDTQRAFNLSTQCLNRRNLRYHHYVQFERLAFHDKMNKFFYQV